MDKKQFLVDIEELLKPYNPIRQKNVWNIRGKLFDAGIYLDQHTRMKNYYINIFIIYNPLRKNIDFISGDTIDDSKCILAMQSFEIETIVFDLKDKIFNYINKYISMETHKEFIGLVKNRYFNGTLITTINKSVFKAPSVISVMKDEETIFEEYVAHKDWSKLDEECKQYWSIKE